jgi:hypothetical protein
MAQRLCRYRQSVRTTKSTVNRKKSTVPRPKLLPVSGEARRWSALLESELLSWPGVITKPMFGFRAVYRGKKIFAALPNSRGFGLQASMLLKFDPMPPALLQHALNDSRFHGNTPGKGWFSFTLSSDTDLHDALEWLNHCYESARKGRPR